MNHRLRTNYLVRVYVTFPTRVETVVRDFLPAPVVRVTVVLPIFVRVVTRVPLFVERTVVLPILSSY